MSAAAVQPGRTIAELRELAALTSDEHGAQRVAWTPVWARAREWLIAKLAELPVEVELDAAGNLWATLHGVAPQALVIGGHLDSVPNGGWLDGALDTLAGLEVLRRVAAAGTPPITLRLVDWADEEGARFGRSLVGSSACSGSLVPADLAALRDRDGVMMPDALRQHGVVLERMTDARRQLATAAAYLELHIEQGPVLESLGLPLGVVLGTFGVERHRITWRGQAAHSGSTPMDRRHDALAGAARLALELRHIAARVGGGGVCTSGSVITRPGIVTAVVETAEQLLDQRHLDADGLAALLAGARAATERFAADERISVTWEHIWRIHPVPFHPELIALADDAVREVAGRTHHLPSGPLHDASEVARAGVPTVMLFVQSLRGLSHTPLEDTREEHVAQAVVALDRLASRTIAWIMARPRGNA
jgi:N-carbamoyl-L-amino-acid hydrolase